MNKHEIICENCYKKKKDSLLLNKENIGSEISLTHEQLKRNVIENKSSFFIADFLKAKYKKISPKIICYSWG